MNKEEVIEQLQEIAEMIKKARRELYYIDYEELTEKQQDKLENAIDLTYELETECDRLRLSMN